MQKEVPSPLAGLQAAAQAEAERMQGRAPVKLWQPQPTRGRRRVGVTMVLGGAVVLAASALAWRAPAPAPVAAPAPPSAALHPAGLWAAVETEPAPVSEAEPSAETPAAMPQPMSARPASARRAEAASAPAGVSAGGDAQEDDEAAQSESHD